MSVTIPLSAIDASTDIHLVGGKAKSLGCLRHEGLHALDGLCIPSSVYLNFVKQTDVQESLSMALYRKPFAVPLAAAITEWRGGMLVHGAIIAREYDMPCVTGVADAIAVVRVGDIHETSLEVSSHTC